MSERYGFAYMSDPINPRFAIRNKEWKLIYRRSGVGIVPLELFNISVDPQEKNNILFGNPEIIEKLLHNIPK